MTDPTPRPSPGTILGRRSRIVDDGGDAVTVAESPDAVAVEASFAGLAAEPVEDPVEGPEPVREAPAVVGRPRPDAESGRLGSRWWMVGCVLFALAALVFAIVGLQQRQALQGERDQTAELRDVSGSTIAALTSYDYQHLDQWKRAVLARATGSFQNQFEAGFSGFEQTYVAEHNRATGSIQGVWVGPVDAGKATTVVLVQITVTSISGTHSLEPYVQVTLLKVAGAWRVDDVQATFDTSGTAGSTPSTTTPAVP